MNVGPPNEQSGCVRATLGPLVTGLAGPNVTALRWVSFGPSTAGETMTSVSRWRGIGASGR